MSRYNAAVWGRCLVLFAIVACGGGHPSGEDAAVAPIPAIEAPASLTLVEGETSTFRVRLAEPPREPVVLHVTSTDPAVAVTPAVITLDARTVDAEIALASPEDDDDVIDEAAEVVLSIDGGDMQRVMTRVIDNDVQQIVAMATRVAVREEESETFGIRLARRPSAPVTVHVWSDAPEIATASPTTLTIDPAHYADPIEVRVAGVQDTNTANGTATIYVGQLQNVTDARVDIDVVDDDVQALVVSAASVPVGEGVMSTFTVQLAFDPLQPTTVSVQSSDPSATAVTASVTFDSSDYNAPKPITLTGLEDVDAVNETATLVLDIGSATANILVPVTDNDLLVADGHDVYEGNSTSFAVRLADPLQAPLPVAVTVVSGDVTLSRTSVLADAQDWSILTVTAGVDSSSNASRPAVVRFSAPGQTPRDVAFTILDRIPGTLSNPTIWQENVVTGMDTDLLFRFTPPNGWPGDGRFVVSFPPGFDASNATFESSTATGSYAMTATTSTLTVVRSNGSDSSAPIDVRVRDVRNPPISGSYPVTIETQTGAGDRIDRATLTLQIFASPMPSASAVLGSLEPGATTTLDVAFTTRNPWPASGILEIYVPSALAIADVSVSGHAGLDGSLTAAVSGAYLTLTRSGGTTVPGGAQVSLTLASIRNPATSLATDDFEITTKTATGASIDVALPKGVVIGCPGSITKWAHAGANVPLGGKPWEYTYGMTGPPTESDAAFIYNVETSDYLVASDFRFAMPTAATIEGIEFEIYRDSWAHDAVDRAVRVVRGSAGTADRSSTTAWAGAPTLYGGSTDLWGESWTTADIESSAFGVAIAAQAAQPGTTSHRVEVRYVTATVYLGCP